MNIEKYTSVLQDPDMLTEEFDILLNELNTINSLANSKFNETDYKKIHKFENRVIDIIHYVINNNINHKDLVKKCLEYTKMSIEKIDNNKESESKKENLQNQCNKLRALLNIDNTNSYNSDFFDEESINDNEIKEKDDIVLPNIDVLDFESYQKFKHEDSTRLYSKCCENNIKKDNGLIYKDETNYKSLKIGDNKLYPIDKYSAQKTMKEKLLICQDPFKRENGIYVDFLNGGNIWIEAENLDNSYDTIDNFILAYIFKIYEEFPLGKVQFLILDKDDKWCYKKIELNMNSENANYLCKNSIRINKDSSAFFNEYIQKKCDEIAKKMTRGINNIYDLCSEDSDEFIRFVIIRNPLNQLQSDQLEKLSNLMKVNDTAHRCGFRFLTILDGKDISELQIDTLNKILLNSEIQFKVEDDSFGLCDFPIKQLSIKDNAIMFVQKASSTLYTELKKLGSSTLSYNDIFPSNRPIENFDDSVIKIPIGKHGSKVFELPFSSANEDQTQEGQIVNYIVIGSTGSGKSSLMHSVIINGARKYSPNDLRFWILDFKNGQESDKYRYANIPHIEMLSSRNTQDDAIQLFLSIKKEMEKRNNLFKGYKDIHTYNKHMDMIGGNHIPHIIVVIDEAQELASNDFSDEFSENVGILNSLIRETSQKIRSYGIHLLLIAQNLSSVSGGFSSSYLPNARGRICFSLDEKALSESEFGSQFNDVRDEIPKLSVGNAYVSLIGSPNKIKLAYVTSFDSYFKEIRQKYASYKMYTKIIGESSKLFSYTKIPLLNNNNYHQIIANLNNNSDYNQEAIIGENSYTLEPLSLSFTPSKNSNLLIIGDTNKMATSIFKSIIKSLVSANNDIYIINGDKDSYIDENNKKILENPLTKYCLLNEKLKNNTYRLNQIEQLLEKIYVIFNERKQKDANSIEQVVFTPIYIFLNDLSKFNEINHEKDLKIMNANKNSYNYDPDNFTADEAAKKFNDESNEDNYESESNFEQVNIINFIEDLIKNGSKYSIYLIVSTIGLVNNDIQLLKDLFTNIIVYNNIQNTMLPESSSIKNRIFNVLKTIKNENGEETRALLIKNNIITKIRPIIYEMHKEEIEMEEL